MLPKTWHFNLNTPNQLAEKLGISTLYLKKLESRIPNCYTTVSITRKGKRRNLYVPSEDLKRIQKLILRKLFLFDFPSCVHGGRVNCSIVTNARPHQQKKWVGCLDIHSFFPSVHYKNIENLLISLNN